MSLRSPSPLRAVALALLVSSLAGCIDYRERLTLREDGSGTLVVDFVVDLGIMQTVARLVGDEPDPEDSKGPTADEIRAGLDVKGVTIQELTVDYKGTKTKVHAKVEFESLQALARIEGFGRDRSMAFYDNGDGKVRVIYGFDTRDVIPIEELTDGSDDAEPDPTSKKILGLVERAQTQLTLRARVDLPGPVLKSNGDPVPDEPASSQWRIDQETDPKRQRVLGRGKVIMMLLCERSSVPFVTKLEPLPRDDPSEEPIEPRKPALGDLGGE